MKILMICESFPETEKAELTGGVETGDYYVARELASENQVTILTGARKDVSRVTQIGPISIMRVGRKVERSNRENPLSRLTFLFSSIQHSFSQDFEIVYASNFFTHLIAAIIALLHHKPAVIKTADVYMGSWIENTRLITGVIGEVIERLTMRYPWNVIISWSEATRKKLLREGVSSPVVVIGGAADGAFCQDLEVSKYQKTTLVCVSRLVSYKRVVDLINAFNLVLRELPDLQLKVIGTGPELASLTMLTKKMGIARSVEFVGFVSSHKKVLEYIKKSHLLVHASEVEGFGLVTLESLACGVPYVHSDLAVTKEITDGGLGGEFFEIGDTKAASEKIIALLTSKKLYNQKVREADLVTKKHSWSSVAKKTEKIFQQAIQKA